MVVGTAFISWMLRMSMAGGHLQKAYNACRRSLTVTPLGKLRGRSQQLMETGIRLIATRSPAWLLFTT